MRTRLEQEHHRLRFVGQADEVSVAVAGLACVNRASDSTFDRSFRSELNICRD